MHELIQDSLSFSLEKRFSRRRLTFTESCHSINGEAMVSQPRESSAKKFLLDMDTSRSQKINLSPIFRKRIESAPGPSPGFIESPKNFKKQNLLCVPSSTLIKRRSLSEYIPPKDLGLLGSQVNPEGVISTAWKKDSVKKTISRGLQSTRPDNEDIFLGRGSHSPAQPIKRILSSEISHSVERLNPKMKKSQRFIGLMLRPSQRSMASSYSDGIGVQRPKTPSIRSPEHLSEPDASAVKSRTVISSKSHWTARDYRALTWESIPEGANKHDSPTTESRIEEIHEEAEDQLLLEDSKQGSRDRGHLPDPIFLKLNLDKSSRRQSRRRDYKLDTIVNPAELLAASTAFQNFVLSKHLPSQVSEVFNLKAMAVRRPSKLRLSLVARMPDAGPKG